MKFTNKGFITTTILIVSIMMIHQSTVLQNTFNQRSQETINTIKLHQETQENKYRLTQGFKDGVEQSMKKTKGQKPIIREQKACEEIQEWLEQLKEEKKMKGTDINLKAGYIDKNSYEYQELITRANNAFELIESKLRKDPLEALGQLKNRATLCVNYITIKEESQEAEIKDNNYLKKQFTDIIDKEPAYKFQVNSNKINQKILIPAKTSITLEDMKVGD
ncbi:MAG: hypothetical protein ACOCTT_01670 [archaeon]